MAFTEQIGRGFYARIELDRKHRRAASHGYAEYGEIIARHIHHGEEVTYVLQGATFETSDGKQIKLPTGAAVINHRDVPHWWSEGGW